MIMLCEKFEKMMREEYEPLLVRCIANDILERRPSSSGSMIYYVGANMNKATGAIPDYIGHHWLLIVNRSVPKIEIWEQRIKTDQNTEVIKPYYMDRPYTGFSNTYRREDNIRQKLDEFSMFLHEVFQVLLEKGIEIR